MTNRPVYLLAIIAAASACAPSVPTAPSGPSYRIEMETGPPETAIIGTTVSATFRLFRRDPDGTSVPVAGEFFTLAVLSGGGTVNGGETSTVTTNANGSAAVIWRLGLTSGPQAVRASLSNTIVLDFGVIALPLPATQLTFVVQAPAMIAPGVVMGQQAPRVQLVDAMGMNVAESSIPVTVTIASGGGTLAGATTIFTNPKGAASFGSVSILGTSGPVTLRFSTMLNGELATLTTEPIIVGN